MESKSDGQTDLHSDYSVHLLVVQNFDTKSLNIVVIDNFDFRQFLRFEFSQQPLHHFAHQWLDNVKINTYAKFDPNITCGSRYEHFH